MLGNKWNFVKTKAGLTQLVVIGLLIILGALWLMFYSSLDETMDYQLIIGRSNDSISLDPATSTDIESFQVTSNIYETLVKTDTNGIDLLPGLAESWKVSEDGLTFVFKLRQNVYFHDHTPLNAEAVVFNFNRWMDENSPYHTGRFTYWKQSFGGEPGIIRSIMALSEDTVEIVLNEPYTPFLSVISMPAFAIASPEAIVKYNENLKVHPVGTGPYRLESWEDSGEIVLIRNDEYWSDLGNIARVVFKTLNEGADVVAMLNSGEIDISTSVSANEIEAIEGSEGATVNYLPFLNISYLVLNNTVEPFDKLAVRQAVALALDQESLVSSSYDALSKPAYSFIPPTLEGYNPVFEDLKYDLERAQNLLEAAGYPEGFKTSIWVMDQPRNYYQDPISVATFISDQLAKIHIEAEVEVIAWSDYNDMLREGTHQMALAGWQGDYADPDNFLYTLFYSSNTDEGTVLNYSYYKNRSLDESLRKARRAADQDFRAVIYRGIAQTLYDDMASIPLAHTMNAIGMSKRVKAFYPHISGVLYINELEVLYEVD